MSLVDEVISPGSHHPWQCLDVDHTSGSAVVRLHLRCSKRRWGREMRRAGYEMKERFCQQLKSRVVLSNEGSGRG